MAWWNLKKKQGLGGARTHLRRLGMRLSHGATN